MRLLRGQQITAANLRSKVARVEGAKKRGTNYARGPMLNLRLIAKLRWCRLLQFEKISEIISQ